MNLLRKAVSCTAQRRFNASKQNQFWQKELDAVLNDWRLDQGFQWPIVSLSVLNYPAVARCISRAFFRPNGVQCGHPIKEWFLELRSLYLLNATFRRSEAVVILGIWDEAERKLLACIHISKGSNPIFLRFLPHGTASYFYLNRLAVIPEARSKGLARRMIQAAEFVVRFLGGTLTVLSVYVNNTIKELYFRMGYQELCPDPRSTKTRPAIICIRYMTTLPGALVHS